MKKVIFLSLVLMAGIAGGIAYFLWPQKQAVIEAPSAEQTEIDLAKVEKLLEEGKGSQAYEIIRKYDRWITPKTEHGSQWLNHLIVASGQIGNVNQLMVVREYFPEFLDRHEQAVVAVAREYIRQKRGEDFERLRNEWRGRETDSFNWLLLDADKFVLEGNRNQAITLLESQTFEGDQETRRLIHLAIISSNRPRESWKYLSEAAKRDPENAELRLYRAKFLEAADKIPFALSEYISAAQLKPDNIFLRDELAEFFIRYYQYSQALEIWKTLIEKDEAPPSVLLKAWFWNKVAFPLAFDWKDYEPAQKSDFFDFLFSLKENEYWNQQAFEKIPNFNRYLRQNQETLWLRVIELLKNGDEQRALVLLENNQFEENSWHKELQTALERVLNYRINGTLVLDEPAIPKKETDLLTFPFFYTLEQLAVRIPGKDQKNEIPEDIRTLLNSEDAFAATFLAGGWFEVGLDLLKSSVIPEEYPDWVSYASAQAIRQNKGDQEALDFATKQRPSPEMDLYIAQLLIDTQNLNAALQKIDPLVDNDDVVSLKARWLKAMILIQKNELEQAKETVEEDPKLAETIYGKELLARIAILQKNVPQAEKIYQSILDQSSEAKSYFARKAFQQKNWEEARKLTEQLFLEFPNNLTIRQNLQRIVLEQKKAEQAMNNETK